MRHYNHDLNTDEVLVTERYEDGGATPFIISRQDMRVLDPIFALPVEVVGAPVVMTDEDSTEVHITRGRAKLIVERPDWKEFQKKVACIEFPMTDVPAEVEIELRVTATHTHTIDTESLIGDDPRWTDDGWEGDVDSLDHAIRDRVGEMDMEYELQDILAGLDYVEEVEADTRW